jgi:4-amino-4-deoxy-L-arabinose transferase-like glycosyltransferase
VKKSNLLSWQALWAVALVAVVLFLALYNLEYYPPTWFDEGVHLNVAKKLALEGKYWFGPAVGPTVFVPVAAAFRVAGVGLLPARLVMVGYLLLCTATFYALAHYLGRWKVATVGTLLFVSSPAVNLLRWGRQVLGEVPAALFFLVGTLLWLRTLEAERKRRRRIRLILAGAFLGLAMLTKNQFLLLLPAWFLLWVVDRLYYRETNHSDFVLPVLSAVACVAAWWVGQRLLLPAGEHLAAQNVQEWSGALSRGILTLSPRRMLGAIKFLTSQDTSYAWVLPACLYAGILSLRRSKEGLRWALLLLVVVVWLGWFVFLSVGWPRYAFLPLAVAGIFVAQVFHDLTEGYGVRIKELVHSEQWDLGLTGKAVLTTLLLVIVVRPLWGRFTEVIMGGEDTAQQMAIYIVEHLPPDAEIETYEPEVCFLSGYACHSPPGVIMDASIKYVWYDAPPPSEYYDLQEYGAPYLLIGDFGRWVHLYDPEIVERDYELCVSIGGYELYRVKQNQ